MYIKADSNAKEKYDDFYVGSEYEVNDQEVVFANNPRVVLVSESQHTIEMI
jgi:hypothetical protein